MAIIKCPECGNDISSLARECVRCGAPIYPFKEIEGDEITLRYHDFKIWTKDKRIIKYVGDAETVDLSKLDIEGLSANLFADNKYLKNIILPETLTVIPNQTFNRCESLSSITFGHKTTRICDGAFYSCTSLKSIKIPAEIEYLGTSAFAFCTSLKEVIIPDDTKLKTISSSLFSGCSALESIHLPRGINTIEVSAFRDCKALRNINIPDSVTSVCEYAFRGCENLEYRQFDNGLYLGNEENPYYLFAKIIDVYKDSLTIHDSCKEIVIGAFEYADSLTTLITPTLGNGAETLQALYGSDGPTYHCHIKELIFKDGIKEINQNINDRQIEKIVIPDSVASINPDSFTSLNEKAYHKGNFLYSPLYVGNENNQLLILVRYPNNAHDRNISITKETRFIQTGAFCNASYLENVSIPNSVIQIGNRAFDGCEKLKEVNFEEGTRLEYIGDGLFYNNINLEKINLPICGTIIGKQAFYNCKMIKTLKIPEGVTIIKDQAFWECRELSQISLPSTLHTIMEKVFCGDSGIKRIDFNKSRKDAKEFDWKYHGLVVNTSVIHFSDDVENS